MELQITIAIPEFPEPQGRIKTGDKETRRLKIKQDVIKEHMAAMTRAGTIDGEMVLSRKTLKYAYVDAEKAGEIISRYIVDNDYYKLQVA